ncbi:MULTISPECIES: hypothetical protein [Gulbenkiania]|uniref:Uncharacterized protein n=1 Tax=Gulbenkiania indica TaxID=375574 RepID=A0A0K6GU73_9NEIS|nr:MULTISPECIES: hypothetical protein [Gulbenkiania]CUA82064.1 hypothetical protein Ga0061063_0919 [Gulbenkiania indica]
MTAPNLCHLMNLQTRMERLRGLDSDVLKAAGVDDILQELAASVEAVYAMRDVVSDLAGLDDALQLLLLLLQRAEDEPISAMGLKNLLEPLCGGLRQQTERLSGLI